MKRYVSLAIMLFVSVLLTITTVSNVAIAASNYQQIIVQTAESHLGEAYVSGGDGNGGYDCIGLVRAAYNAIGINLPRAGTGNGTKTWAEQGLVKDVTGSTPMPGDILCWYKNQKKSGQPDHVAIYTGQVKTNIINGTYKGYKTDSEGYVVDEWGRRIDCINALNPTSGVCYIPVEAYFNGVNTSYTDLWRADKYSSNSTSNSQSSNLGSNSGSFSVGGGPDVTFTTDETRQSIGKTNAVLAARIDVSGAQISDITSVGIKLYDASGKQLATTSENVHYTDSYMLAWYDVNSELKYTLSPGTTYQYSFFAVVGPTTYSHKAISFTTQANAASTTNSIKNYTVTLNPKGGTVSSTSITVVKGGKYGTLPTPTKSGYTFRCWSTDESGTFIKTVTANTTVSKNENHTLFAHYWTNDYIVTLNANGGNVSPATHSVRYEEAYGYNGAMPTPSRDGYKFLGWYTAASGGSLVTDSNTYTATDDQMLYAHWEQEIKTYNVAFDANGGNTSKSKMTVTYGEAYGEMPVPTRDGYTFVGWYTTAGGGAQITKSTICNLTSNQTLYAHWSQDKKTYTLSFSNNDGTASNYTKQVTNGEPYGSLPTPISNGYQFIGWYTLSKSDSGIRITSDTIVELTSDQTLYAHWKKDTATYAVMFNANGGKVTMSEKSVTNGDLYGAMPTPTRDGYSFSGWFTSANGGTQIESTTSVNLTENQTLYAHWKANNRNTENLYEVHFERQNIYHQDQFLDIPANQWYTSSVAGAFEFGLMKGNSNTTFNPYGDVTIAEAITMAARIHSTYSTGSENFTQSGVWYQVYLDYAYKNGIIGRAYYNSDVTKKATRAQFAEIFANSMSDEGLHSINQVDSGAIPDVSISTAYAPGVYQLYRAGILTGSDANGSFNPQTYITRAEAAAIVSRMADSNNRVSFELKAKESTGGTKISINSQTFDSTGSGSHKVEVNFQR